jgi:4-aminobutyrate aminotransferase-like enzyme
MSSSTAAELLARRQRALGASYRLFYEEPFAPVRGEGVWLYDKHNAAYLDAYNNVASIGHCHPAVVAAIAEQSALLNTHTRYLHPSIVEYAEDLLSEFHPQLDNMTMTCTGSEANDLALRIARCHSGGTGIIVTRWAYHGVTSALAEVSPSLATGLPTASHVRLVEAPDSYRRTADFVANVKAAVQDMQAQGIKPAALLVDSIFSSDGVFSPANGELAAAAQCVRDAGGLYIADEVQPGFGRTGGQRWGFARESVIPDLVTLGKPMGNGHPVAAVVGRSALFDQFGHQQRYFNTYGVTRCPARLRTRYCGYCAKKTCKPMPAMSAAISRRGCANWPSAMKSLAMYAARGCSLVSNWLQTARRKPRQQLPRRRSSTACAAVRC